MRGSGGPVVILAVGLDRAAVVPEERVVVRFAARLMRGRFDLKGNQVVALRTRRQGQR